MIVVAKITMRWLRILRVSLSIVSVKAKSLFSLTYDQGVEKRCRLFWLTNSASYMSDTLERKRQNAVAAIYHWLFTAMDMEPNYSVYLTYGHDVSNAIFIHSVVEYV
jgi:hypothetical protein